MRAPVYVTLFLWVLNDAAAHQFTEEEMASTRQRIRSMFYHAYNSYLDNAFPYDELRPLTCDGQDTWGSFSLTLIDALDTLLVLGNQTEFQRVASLLQDTIDFDTDVNASVFETNIRAFQTATGMPYGTVNLLKGVSPTETSVTCTAGVGTFILEFATLSRLTGDATFENVARRALRALWKTKSDIGLVGNHIDVQSQKWVAQDAGIGAGVDSYFEYLVKGAIMLQDEELLHMFLGNARSLSSSRPSFRFTLPIPVSSEYDRAIQNYTRFDDWYLWVQMHKGTVSMPVFQSLEAFWPGLQSLLGNLDSAVRTFQNYYSVWRQFGGLPEFYSIPQGSTVDKREGYPLRPGLTPQTHRHPQKWDPTLKVVAEEYASKCIWNHNPDLEDTGENLYVTQGPLDLREALEKWFLGEWTDWCCRLDMGNYEDERPYVEGDWCSRCPENLQKCENNLCVADTVDEEDLDEGTVFPPPATPQPSPLPAEDAEEEENALPPTSLVPPYVQPAATDFTHTHTQPPDTPPPDTPQSDTPPPDTPPPDTPQSDTPPPDTPTSGITVTPQDIRDPEKNMEEEEGRGKNRDATEMTAQREIKVNKFPQKNLQSCGWRWFPPLLLVCLMAFFILNF
ncbi:hypothetical protein fugu_006834 [Takifugu bimaculatus]|uniref:alpha-1,2-Mannosidase n=1 Tax=Takifugu bimaculatus TaxID=433685 RepID=A0A4Z2B2J8_9TELE|nr:hypothetical protein fugu_006834 [Takifugu bimaculatus]